MKRRNQRRRVFFLRRWLEAKIIKIVHQRGCPCQASAVCLFLLQTRTLSSQCRPAALFPASRSPLPPVWPLPRAVAPPWGGHHSGFPKNRRTGGSFNILPRCPCILQPLLLQRGSASQSEGFLSCESLIVGCAIFFAQPDTGYRTPVDVDPSLQVVLNSPSAITSIQRELRFKHVFFSLRSRFPPKPLPQPSHPRTQSFPSIRCTSKFKLITLLDISTPLRRWVWGAGALRRVWRTQPGAPAPPRPARVRGSPKALGGNRGYVY